MWNKVMRLEIFVLYCNLRLAFDKFDLNKDGKLSKDELLTLNILIPRD